MRKGIRRVLSFILSLCLLIGGLGASPMELQAEGESTTGTVIYVGGVGASDENDGTTELTSVKTLKAAYGKVPSDNVKSTIVVMSELQLAPDEAPLTKSGNDYVSNTNFVEDSLDLDWSVSIAKSEGSGNVDCYKFPEHTGEVVITSKIGETTYENGALNFNNKAFTLYGNTTIENIKISEKADLIYARFHDLTLGDGITSTETYLAKRIYMGIATKVTWTTGSEVTDFTDANDVRSVNFTLKSGKVERVYGGNRTFSVEGTGSYDVNLNINGGYIYMLYGTSEGNTSSKADYQHNNVNISFTGGTIDYLYGLHAGTQLNGNLKITLAGSAWVKTKLSGLFVNSSNQNAIVSENSKIILELQGAGWKLPSTVTGFDSLQLSNSQLTIADTSNKAWWSAIKSLEMTDDSALTFTSAPTNEVQVTVTNNDDTWNTTTALITAPTGTGDIFNFTTPEGYSLTKAGGESVTWTLTANSTATAALVNGTAYATLQNAIAAADELAGTAAESVEITLQANTTSDETITINEGVILDLNGYTLDMGDNYLNSYGNVVDNSTNKTGRLKVTSSNGTLSATNSQVPIYIDGEGYMFATMKGQSSVSKTDDSFTIISRPSFGTAYGKLAGGAAAAKLQFIVRLDWTENGEAKYQEFKYNEATVQAVYGGAKAFSVTVNGLSEYKKTMKVTILVRSTDLEVDWVNNEFYMSTSNE